MYVISILTLYLTAPTTGHGHPNINYLYYINHL